VARTPSADARMTHVSDVRAVRMPVDDDLRHAADVVFRELEPSPIVASPRSGDGVVLKLESLQPTGSFKVRGGLAAMSRAAADGVSVIAASAGNHALGVAYGAARFGVPATVVVPENASAKKLQALGEFPCTLVRHGDSYDDAEQHALALAAANREQRFVSPYNDPDVIAGQSTIALELLLQVPDLTTVVVPVSGGGLIAGIVLGLASKARQNVRVVGVVAAASPAMLRAYEAGHVEPVSVEPTLADGLAGNLEPATITIDIARQHVDSIVEVDEESIADGMRLLAFEHGVVSEGSGAVGVAALQTGAIEPAGEGTTAVIVTGRNIASATLAAVLVSG
jgi:threonine dehydratase